MSTRNSLFKLIFLLGLMICTALSTAWASESNQASSPHNEWSFFGGAGTGNIAGGHYNPILLILHWGTDVKHKFPSLKEHGGEISFFVEAQANPSFHPNGNIEFGVSPGFQYRYPFSRKLWGYLLVSVGPHYISLVTRGQQNGFIFANTLGAGIYYFLDQKSALVLGYRFRHMSNAGLVRPNDGIDTDFLTLGYAVFF